MKHSLKLTILCFVVLFSLPCGATGLEQKKTFADLPPAAQASISEAIGRDVADFHTVRTSEGFRAENDRHKLSATFTSDGATVSKGTDRWSLQLVSFGRESDLYLVSKVEPQASTNRVEYHRELLTEWYVNGPIGLEQGFTIPIRPDGPGGKRLVIALSGAGLQPEVSGEGSLSLVRSDGSEAFRYGGLAAWDADGKKLPVQIAVVDHQVLLKVDDRNACYPVTVDPVYQASRLTSDDGATNDRFGKFVAISGDGNTALVWALNRNVGANSGQGSAYVFIRNGATWALQAHLTSSDDATSYNFGQSVALSNDGNIALVGAPSATFGVNTPNQGAAYVFIRSGGTWAQQAILTASDGAMYDHFGYAVSLSGDGSTALIGAYSKNIGENYNQGAAYVFNRSGIIWSQQASLTTFNGASYNWFGYRVTLSGDGNTALIGAPMFGDAFFGINDGPGTAFVFNRSGTTWNGQQQLFATDGIPGDWLGSSVALTSDGNTALVGAYGANAGRGAAYAFTRSGNIWSQQARLVSSDRAADDNFAQSVALSSDGNTALAGAYYKSIGTNTHQGAVYAFSRSGETWNQQAQLTYADSASYDWFGHSVALSSNGNTFLVGADSKTIGTNMQQGAAYIFDTAYLLTVTVPMSGPALGSGLVTSDTGGINCSSGSLGTCNATYLYGTTVSLAAATSTSGSTFTGWGQDCSGYAPCLLAMMTDMNVAANFSLGPDGKGPVARISSTGYDSISNAYSAAGAGASIQAVTGNHTVGTLTMDRGMAVTLKGGYDAMFQTTDQPTILQGALFIRSGSLVVDNIRIQPVK